MPDQYYSLPFGEKCFLMPRPWTWTSIRVNVQQNPSPLWASRLAKWIAHSCLLISRLLYKSFLNHELKSFLVEEGSCQPFSVIRKQKTSCHLLDLWINPFWNFEVMAVSQFVYIAHTSFVTKLCWKCECVNVWKFSTYLQTKLNSTFHIFKHSPHFPEFFQQN